MTTLRQAAQQALEALQYGKPNKAITILREALEREDCQGWVSSPKREWVGLTPEEVKHLYPYGRSVWGGETYEAIEKALREKND